LPDATAGASSHVDPFFVAPFVLDAIFAGSFDP